MAEERHLAQDSTARPRRWTERKWARQVHASQCIDPTCLVAPDKIWRCDPYGTTRHGTTRRPACILPYWTDGRAPGRARRAGRHGRTRHGVVIVYAGGRRGRLKRRGVGLLLLTVALVEEAGGRDRIGRISAAVSDAVHHMSPSSATAPVISESRIVRWRMRSGGGTKSLSPARPLAASGGPTPREDPGCLTSRPGVLPDASAITCTRRRGVCDVPERAQPQVQRLAKSGSRLAIDDLQVVEDTFEVSLTGSAIFANFSSCRQRYLSGFVQSAKKRLVPSYTNAGEMARQTAPQQPTAPLTCSSSTQRTRDRKYREDGHGRG